MHSTMPPLWEQVKPLVPCAERKTVLAGRVSRTRTLVASCVPMLSTVIVYVWVPLVAIGSKPGAESTFRMVRSMPVTTWVTWLALLLVSSASKMALFGSTVMVLAIGPVPGGATRTIWTVLVDSGGMVPPVHVTTPPAWAHTKPAPLTSTKRSNVVPAGSGSRRTTPVAARMPLLPTTKVYVRPPRHTGGASSGGTAGAGWAALTGHELAQTGSGVSAFVTVRSIDGFTVVNSVSVVDDPLFLMFPVTVAVLTMFDPAAATTWPVTVISTVPPGFNVRIEHRVWGAVTVQPPNVPTVPLVTTWLT